MPLALKLAVVLQLAGRACFGRADEERRAPAPAVLPVQQLRVDEVRAAKKDFDFDAKKGAAERRLQDAEVSFAPYYGYMSEGDDIMDPVEMTTEEAKLECEMRTNCIGFTFMGSRSDKLKHLTWFKDSWDIWGDPGWTSFKRVYPDSLDPKPLIDTAALAKIYKSRPRFDGRRENPRLREIRGVAYGPVPNLQSDDVVQFPDHFVMGHWYRGQWANDGRNDLGLLKQLGANAVLLRGRGPWHKPWSHSDENKPLCHFKWFRFVPMKIRGALHKRKRRWWQWGGVQITQIHLRHKDTDVSFDGAKAEVFWPWWGHDDTGPDKAIDGKDNTQWRDPWMQEISIEMPNEVEVDSFSFTTGPDRLSDDPIRWQFLGSKDNEVWSILHDQDVDYETPEERRQQTEWFGWGNDDCRRQHRGEFNPTGFLDNAGSLGMKVIVGLPDHPFFMAHKACAKDMTDLDCYRIMKRHYWNKLETGFTIWKAKKQDYHPAIDTVVLMNKPEKKLKKTEGKGMVENYMRAIISAFDGMLAAEQTFGIDPLLGHTRFSVTFDYTPCPTCKSFEKLTKIGCCVPCGHGLGSCSQYGEVGHKMACTKKQINAHTDRCPVLAQILDLHLAMKHPESVGYTPMTTNPSLFEAYQERWVHSFHSQMSFRAVRGQVLEKYIKMAEQFNIRRGEDRSDDLMPIFIGEFHSFKSHDVSAFKQDLRLALDYSRSSENPFIGLNVFTFQAPDEPEEPCDLVQWRLFTSGQLQVNPCPHRSNGLFALGDLKVGESAHVPMLTDEEGEEDQRWKDVPIYCLQPAVPGKLEALAATWNGTVPDTETCRKGATAEPALHCVANRSAPRAVVNEEAAFACEKLRGKYDCVETPSQCEEGYELGDWALSVYVAHYADLHPNQRERLCNTDGAGVLTAFPPRPECTADPDSVTPAGLPTFSPGPTPPEDTGGGGGRSIPLISLCLIILCATLGCCLRLHKRRVQQQWARMNDLTRFRSEQVTRPTVQQPLHEDAAPVPQATLELADWS